MADPGCALAEQLLHDEDCRSFRSRKALLLGTGIAAFLALVSYSRGQLVVAHEPAITIALPRAQPTSVRQSTLPARTMQPAMAWQSLQPAATRGRQMQRPAAAGQGAAVKAVASPTLDTKAMDTEMPLKPDLEMPGKPGLAEDPHFKLDESVIAWKNFQQSGPVAPLDNVRKASEIALSIASQGAEGSVYSVAHGLRTGYFAANAALSTIAGLALQLPKQLGALPGGLSEVGLFSGGETGTDGATVLSRFLLEASLCYQQDYRAITQGLYKLPWDMYTPGHRQLSPQYAVQQTLREVEEAVAISSKSSRGGLPDDVGIWLESPLYPDYYKNNFHYQTDGWMADRSAKVYETSTETLFFGRQDAMQRLSLLPLHNMASTSKRPLRILEVACGTGRFATFMRDNHPDAQLTLVDLSPFYLEAARENDDYWRRLRYPSEATRPPAAKFVQAAAEALPFEDASFDAVVCVYLFHEMPEAARAAAAAEMARVVAPGGVVILTDSVQLGDRPDMDYNLVNFEKLNEPHYDNYINTYLPALFNAGGLVNDGKWVESVSKCISFRKPADESAGALPA
eukprot:gnl/TRDRNA2_/TRDRNA2_136405_c0_seq1.p1 gnl/TRDRNA2_/TRDRNA2_136405_c0~~gnl/TRDRNA2_/TRDRNA2_136405_c0_seq1.p1  ORF type:complete len:569 (-),score=98.26 gnl/TRDRNA2_/TRDRNA2_136405_c0_seq1:100-1806(-)